MSPANLPKFGDMGMLPEIGSPAAVSPGVWESFSERIRYLPMIALLLLFQAAYSAFIFNPARKWLFGGSFRNVTLGSQVANGIAAYAGGNWGTYGNGTYDGSVHVIRVDSQFNVYIAGTFTHMYGNDGFRVATGPIAMWPYHPFEQPTWQSVSDLPVEFLANDLPSAKSTVPIIHDISTDCWNAPKKQGLSCDVYVAGEFKFVAADASSVTNDGPGGLKTTYNLVKWDANDEKWDLLTPPASFDSPYMLGPIYAVHKKDYEPNPFSKYKSDKKVWLGGAFPTGFGLLPMWDGDQKHLYIPGTPDGNGETTIVRDILYVSRYSDEIWVGGSFNFTSASGKDVRNFANFNHKSFQNAGYIASDDSRDPWEVFGATNEDVASWPRIRPSSLQQGGICSISANGLNKYVSGWDIEIPPYTGDYQGVFELKDGHSSFQSPDLGAFEDEGIVSKQISIKKIHVCEDADLGCEAGSMIMVGTSGYVKYYNSESKRMENFGDSETPFGTSESVEFVLSKWMLGGTQVKVALSVLAAVVMLLVM